MAERPLDRVEQPKRVLRVGELTRYLKNLVECDELLALIQVQGELTNLSRSGSGWIYFSIKDRVSQLRCVVAPRAAATMRGEVSVLENGITLLLEGSITVYEPAGSYQMAVNRMKVGGAGAARLRFEQLKKKLLEEGLFATDRKRPLPQFPRRIVLVTAPNSQAYHDVLKRLEFMRARVTVIVAAVAVQGEHAAGQIATAIDIANRSTASDVIVIARGGGAPEELECFNDERLARAIFSSRLPVITGIGHTQDTTIADLVADAATPTPTAAAGAAVADERAIAERFQQRHRSMHQQMCNVLQSRRQSLVQAEAGLMRVNPASRIFGQRQQIDALRIALERATTSATHSRRAGLEALRNRLEALSPMAVLDRGYAVLSDTQTGAVVSSKTEASQGRRLTARVKDGSFDVTVAS